MQDSSEEFKNLVDHEMSCETQMLTAELQQTNPSNGAEQNSPAKKGLEAEELFVDIIQDENQSIEETKIEPKIDPKPEPKIEPNIEIELEAKIEPPKAVHEKMFTSEMTEVQSENGSSEGFEIELTKELKASIYDLKDDAEPEELADLLDIPVKLVQSYLQELDELEEITEKHKTIIRKLQAQKIFSQEQVIQKAIKMTKLKEKTIKNFLGGKTIQVQ